MTTDRIRVLLVDADAATVGRYAHWTPDRWLVTAVESGRRALSAVDEDTDIAVLGTDLPDRPTYRLIGRVQSRGSGTRTVVAGVDGESVDWGTHGADETIPAPVDGERFRATLDRLADQVAYDRRLQEYFSLVSERTVMEARLSGTELDESEEYRELVARIDEVSEDLNGMLDDIAAADDYANVFQGFFPGTGLEG